MADRKRQVEQAISESVEMSKAPKPAKPAAKTPGEKLKSFSLNSREKADAAAPLHPRAAKGQSVRTRELQAGMAAGRQTEARNAAAGAAVIAEGKGITGHKLVKNSAPYQYGPTDKDKIGPKNYKTVPAVEPINAEQIAPPTATKKPKPSKPKRMKKASTPQLRFKGE
jgi:hypothetical protein